MAIRLPREWTDHIRILGNADFPSYLVTGEKACAIVEGGCSLVADMVLAQLDNIPDLPTRIYLVVSHAHADHVSGLIRMKQRRPELLLVGSKSSDQLLRKPKIIQKFSDEDRICSALLKKNKSIEWIEDGPERTIEPVEMDIIKSAGDVLDLGQVPLRFIDTPGHAPGAMAVQVAPDDALLISDSAGMIDDRNPTVFPLFFVNYQSYIRSLNVLKHLKAIHVGLGHYLTVDGKDACRTFFDMSIQMAEQLKHEVCIKIKRHVPEKDIRMELAERMRAYCRLLSDHPLDMLADFAGVLVRRAQEC